MRNTDGPLLLSAVIPCHNRQKHLETGEPRRCIRESLDMAKQILRVSRDDLRRYYREPQARQLTKENSMLVPSRPCCARAATLS